jgi:uncharacterized protein (TIGR02145 family)
MRIIKIVLAGNLGLLLTCVIAPNNIDTLPRIDFSAIPTSVAASAGDGMVTITWNAVVEATSYNLYYDPGSSVTTSNTKISNVTSPYNLTGLTNGTQYAFAVSSVSATGESILSSIVTATPRITVTDIDGNVYHAVTIGAQVWTVENLRTTRYSDGTAIPLVMDNTEWSAVTTPAYCCYNNDPASYDNTYGALYNWYAVNTGKLPPTGWHVPTDSEWITLATYLGGESVAGGKLKETGTAHWVPPNVGATNVSCFSALPGGGRSSDGAFFDIGTYGDWWSSTGDADNSWIRLISGDSVSLIRGFSSNRSGYSVRCIRD